MYIRDISFPPDWLCELEQNLRCCSVISPNCPQAAHFIGYERQYMASEKQRWQILYLSFFCATGFLNELANCSDLTHKELSHSSSQASNCAEMIMMTIIIMMIIMGTGEKGKGWESGLTSKRQMRHRGQDQTLIQCKPTLLTQTVGPKMWDPSHTIKSVQFNKHTHTFLSSFSLPLSCKTHQSANICQKAVNDKFCWKKYSNKDIWLITNPDSVVKVSYIIYDNIRF